MSANAWTEDERLTHRWLSHYDTIRGVVRHHLALRQLLEHAPAASSQPPVRVIDVGGGDGRQAISLARLGYEVTVVEPSRHMVAAAHEALDREADTIRRRVTVVQRHAEQVEEAFGPDRFDLALCHGLLLYLADPAPVCRQIARVVRPGGIVSVMTKNALALAMRPGLQGDFAEAVASFKTGQTVGWLGEQTRGDTPDSLSGLLSRSGVEPITWYGACVFTEHRDDPPPSPDDLATLLEAEWLAGATDPYRLVSRLIHMLGRRR